MHEQNNYPTPIQFVEEYNGNKIFMKRDDLTEPTFGGNKVRKLELFLQDAKLQKANYIITYGSAQSNHCRLTVAMANKMGFKTLLILAKDKDVRFNGNYLIYNLFDTKIVWTDVNKVPETIEKTLSKVKKLGDKPYFIQGGGHGNLGTHAYKLAYDELIKQQQTMSESFHYIFHASGTGTTQAGLIAGNIVHKNTINIIGISVARNQARGIEVIKESVKDYFDEYYPTENTKDLEVNFLDDYVGNGYADIYPEIPELIKRTARKSSVLLDPVYTGKAYYGMLDYIAKNNVGNKNILFIHTGGTPLLFNYANKFKEG